MDSIITEVYFKFISPYPYSCTLLVNLLTVHVLCLVKLLLCLYTYTTLVYALMAMVLFQVSSGQLLQRQFIMSSESCIDLVFDLPTLFKTNNGYMSVNCYRFEGNQQIVESLTKVIQKCYSYQYKVLISIEVSPVNNHLLISNSELITL